MSLKIQKKLLPTVIVAVLLCVFAIIALPAMAAEPESFYGVNVSASGSVSINFYYESLGNADSVCVIERNSQGTEVSRKTLPVDGIVRVDGKYAVQVKLPAAKMTSLITVYTVKDGARLGDEHTYSVKSYVEQLLNDASKAEYYDAAKAMLNYGAMAQAHFGVNTDSLANSGMYRNNTNPINAVTAISCTPISYTDGESIKFKGYEAVLEDKVALRFYFTYDGSEKLAASASRDGLEARSTDVYYSESRGQYYIKINNISPKLYATGYNVTVGAGGDALTVSNASVMSYMSDVLNGNGTTDTQKNVVRAMYNHYIWTTGTAPSEAACTHGSLHCESANGDTASSYVCSVCGINVKTVSDSIEYFVSAKDVLDKYVGDGNNQTGELKTDSDGTVYAQLHGGSTIADKYNSLKASAGARKETGRFLIMKYRLPSSNPTSQPSIPMFVRSTNASSSWKQVTITAHQDDAWHTVVLDLAQLTNATSGFLSDDDGKYYTDANNDIWIRPLSASGQGTENDTMDIAYIAMCDDISELSGLIDEQTYERHLSSTSYADVYTLTGLCVYHTYAESGSAKNYVYTCSLCNHVLEYDVDRYFTMDMIRTNQAHLYKLTPSSGEDTENNIRFVRFGSQSTSTTTLPSQLLYNRYPIRYTNNSDGTQTTENMGLGTAFNIGSGDKYLVFKYRTNDTSWKHRLDIGTKNANTIVKGEDDKYTGSVTISEYNLPLSSMTQNEWTTVVIDLAKYCGNGWIADENGDYWIETLIFHCGSMPAGVYFDIASLAFVDSWEDVAAVSGDETAICVGANGSSGVVNTADGVCLTGKCSVTCSNDGNTYKCYCLSCGKVYAQRDISGANKFVDASQINGYSSLFFENKAIKSEYNAAADTYEIYSSRTYTYSDFEGWMYLFAGHVEGGLPKVSIADTGRYLVVRMRTTSVDRITLQARTGDNDASEAIRRTGLNQGWETMIIDLTQFANYETNATDTTFTFRFKIFRSSKNDPAQTVDIAYAAIVDTLDEAVAVTGDGKLNLYEDWASTPATYTKTSVVCSGGSVLGHVCTSTSCSSAKVCDICGTTFAEASEHNFVNAVDSKYLASRATATTAEEYYKSCSMCGVCGTDTFTHGQTLSQMTDLEKIARYKTLTASIQNGESFLYFSDPHYVGASENGTILSGFEYYIDMMGIYFKDSNASFALSGGDWLNNSNTKSSALSVLADIDRRMAVAFGDGKYYLTVGNHDYNYQIVKNGSTVASDYKLTNAEIDSVWYTDDRYDTHHSYYSFMGDNTRFYVFDSGIDWGHTTLTDLDKTQLTWFLEQLSSRDDTHIALAPHMLYTSGETLNPGTEKALEFSEIYNKRGTVEFEGETYDFSSKTGYVEFLIAGHKHVDLEATHYNIPCFLVFSNGQGTGSLFDFDMVAVDYDERVLYTVRVNNSSVANATELDRVISLYNKDAE